MKNKRFKITLIVICCVIAYHLVLGAHVIIRLRTCDPCDGLIEFLKTDDEIADVCGEFHRASLYITGSVKFGHDENDFTKQDKDSGYAALRLKFKAENGSYIITAYITGEDGVWTVTEYELTEESSDSATPVLSVVNVN